MAPNPTSSALVPVKVDNDNLVEEKIDERILAILGIGDVFDLTYEEYIGLLKEKSIEYRMKGADVPTESVELITEEFKRVKGKTGKFKVKSQKIDFQKVVNVRAPSPQKAQLDPSKLLPPSKEEEPVEVKKEPSIGDILNFLKGDLLDGLKSIVESLNNINQTLKEQNQIDKKTRESQRKSAELEKKSRRESELESKPGKNKEEEKKLKTPVVSFFDSIKKFVTNVLLGSVVLGLFKWLKDPKNEKAINGFGEFLTDNAPLILGGLLAIAALPIASTFLALTNSVFAAIGVLITAGNVAKSLLDKLRSTPPPPPTPPTPTQPSQMQGGSNTGLFYGKNVDPKTGRQLRGGPSISRYNESFARVIQGNANLGDRLRVGFRDSTYGMRNFLDKANLKVSSSWEFVKSKFSPVVSNKIQSFAPKLRGLGFGAFRALGSILRLIGLGFLVAELQQDWNNKDYYAIIVKLAAYGAGWIVTSLGFLASGALVSTGLGSPAGIALSVASMAAGAGTDAAIRHFLLKGRKKTQSPEPKDPYAGADGLQRQLDDLAKAQPPTVQPQTPLMPGLPPSAAQPGTGPAGNRVGMTTKTITPTITGRYGEQRGAKTHGGTDLAVDDGTPLAALTDGQIIDSGREPRGWGNFLVFRDNQGINHLYGHIQDGYKTSGNVKKGEVIARVGMTGRTSGPHLHWESGTGWTGGVLTGKFDPLNIYSSSAPFTFDPTIETRLTKAQVARTPAPTPSIPSPSGRSNITMLPLSTGTSSQQVSSGTSPNQAPVPNFSSEDPNNMTMLTVKAIYNVVG